MAVTGPHGHVQKWIVDLERKAMRCCFYLHDTLYHEYTMPIDIEAPLWIFAEKFATV